MWLVYCVLYTDAPQSRVLRELGVSDMAGETWITYSLPDAVAHALAQLVPWHVLTPLELNGSKHQVPLSFSLEQE